KRLLYEERLVNREAAGPPTSCAHCNKEPGTFVCDTCITHRRHCGNCLVDRHASLPFHHVREDVGLFLKRADLGELGLMLWLGHDGKPCPKTLEAARAKDWVDESSRTYGSHAVARGGSVLTMVDAEGVFRRTVQWCSCSPEDATSAKEVQLLDIGLYPATSDNPQTAFTLSALEDYTLSQFESRTSAQNYMLKLSRKTDPLFPHEVKDVYRPFMRVARQYRNFVERRNAGVAHEAWKAKGFSVRRAGDLAWRCPACPQPGINLPADEQRDSEHPELYMPMYTHDGCFKLNNQRMRNPGADVRLSDGECMHVGSKAYAHHLRVTKEPKSRRSCQNHRAVTSGRSGDRNLAATGMGAYACARHGMFVANTAVDYQKGEAQRNTDYATSCLIEGLSPRTTKVLIAYDIMCEYIVNLAARLKEGQYLTNRKVVIEAAVGKFHIGAHVRNCFAMFSPNFIHGAAQLDGEVLETLWAALEKVAANTRSMSAAHRQEVLDMLMNDINWKKLVKCAESLLQKWEKAVVELATAREAYDSLKATLAEEDTRKWIEEEREALVEGREGKRVYDIRQEDAPGVAEKALEAAQKSGGDGDEAGLKGVTLLREALRIEAVQDALLPLAKQTLRTPSQEQDLLLRRQKLRKRITKYNSDMGALMGLDADDEEGSPAPANARREHTADADLEAWLDIEEDTGGLAAGRNDSDDEGDDDADAVDYGQPEEDALLLPSTTGWQEGELAEQETALRHGLKVDSLRGVRLSIATRSRHYRQDVRQAKGSQRTTTRAFAAVRKAGVKLARHVRAYHRARDALKALGQDEKTMPMIKKADLRMEADWTEENRVGQRSHQLPWFWRVGDGAAGDDAADDAGVHDLYRVSFLRSRCRLQRWEEEERLLRHEMLWTRLFFEREQRLWAERAADAATREGGSGWAGYANGRSQMWGALAEDCVSRCETAVGGLPGWVTQADPPIAN
ncbi:hypothetical protein BD626DRAFT_394088, partial [Schizophyllum amplum]